MSGTKPEVLVVGGGAAGMMAAFSAARAGASVTLLEKNEKLGKKIYITGKGRCNLTNASGPEVFREHVVTNPRFLYSALERFGPEDIMSLLETWGTPVKTERGRRVFPVSDHASDVTRALKKALDSVHVRICLHADVRDLIRTGSGKVSGVKLADGTELAGGAVIVATGGLSYPSTGSTGDGYRFAASCGHTLQPCRPSLVQLLVKEEEICELEGLSLRNVALRVQLKKGRAFSEFGELLFTGKGISGPIGLTASARLGKELESRELTAELDMKPALSDDQLDGRLLREFSDNPNRSLKNVLRSLLPASFVPVFCRRMSFDTDRPVHEITKGERREVLQMIRAFPFTLTGTGGFAEAVITQGGITVKEIDPKTMASRRCSGLYFAGEVLDLDALTGGYNLQIAWSTGYCSGYAAAVQQENDPEQDRQKGEES